MPPPLPNALLLVDGYNVIGAWSSLKQIRDRHGLPAARQELVEALVNYTAFQGYQTEVVFDAQYQKTQTHQEAVTSHLAICYTDFGQTADTYIEKFCAAFRQTLREGRQRLIVATSDRAQQLIVVGYGAEWMSSQQLASEVELSTHHIRRQHRPPKQSRGRFLFHSLDANAQKRLAEWRRGIR